MINIRTIIGLGSQHQNTGKAHGAALGEDDVVYVKTQLGFHPDEMYVVPPQVYDYFAECKIRGARDEEVWNEMMTSYSTHFPDEHAELKRRIDGKLREGWENDLPTKDKLPKDPAPTRKSSGIVVDSLVPKDKTFVAGSADLLESTFVSFSGMTEFQNVSVCGGGLVWMRLMLLKPASKLGDYAGRQIRYGIREHAMVGIGNGFAAYQKGSFIPIMSTFFMFWLYAAPAVRMSALMGLRYIGIATHDAIGIGEDGEWPSQGSA